jgi:hypothetical protein
MVQWCVVPIEAAANYGNNSGQYSVPECPVLGLRGHVPGPVLTADAAAKAGKATRRGAFSLVKPPKIQDGFRELGKP